MLQSPRLFENSVECGSKGSGPLTIHRERKKEMVQGFQEQLLTHNGLKAFDDPIPTVGNIDTHRTTQNSKVAKMWKLLRTAFIFPELKRLLRFVVHLSPNEE